MKNPLENHPVALASAFGALLALMGQSAFNKIFDGVYAVITERVQFPMTLRQIEYYRTVLDPCSPQVRNTIENLNARIEYEHEANRQWRHYYSLIGLAVDLASTDQWNAVRPIALNCKPTPNLAGFELDRPLTLPPVPAAMEVKK